MRERYPDCKITVVCGWLPAPLFARCPYVDKVVVLPSAKGWPRLKTLLKTLLSKKWRAVIDLRNSPISRFPVARDMYVLDHGIPKELHKIEQLRRAVKADALPMPRLWVSGEAHETPTLALAPTANWVGKMWPVENFIALVNELRAGPLKGWNVAVFGAAHERDQAQPLLDAFPDALDCIGTGDTAETADALARCRLFIGNDSGLMHIAGAIGMKTVGLFGPTYDTVYGPMGGHTRVVRTPESVETLLALDTDGTRMGSLPVADVVKAVNELL